MASVKHALLDQLPCKLRSARNVFSGFRLGVVVVSAILLFLIFLCSNYSSKKTYLLRPTFYAFVPAPDSSGTVLLSLYSSVINNATKSANNSGSLEVRKSDDGTNRSMVVSDGIRGVDDHTHLRNLSLSLEMKNGVTETLVQGQTLVANTTNSSKDAQCLASNGSDAGAKKTHLGDFELEVRNPSFHGGEESDTVGNLRSDKGKVGNSSDRGEIPLPNYSTQLAKKGYGDLSKSCDIFDGQWVRDDSKPYYPPGSCPYIDRDFDCVPNGRPEYGFVKWRWQPNACNIPHLNATDFLERLKGKKLVFVGDSLNRNMWESLVCILRHSIRNKKRVYEISGRTEFKKKGFYAFRFEDYNCSVDFVGSPFLLREFSYHGKNGSSETLRLDLMDRTTSMYQDADILVFNTGHWWTHEKTSRGEDYYQEGNHVYQRFKVQQAYRKALTTWSRWVDEHIDANKTLVFFRGYSIIHFRGGQWNSGGQCHNETEPIFNNKHLRKYPSKMRALEQVLQGMKTPVIYLNISRITAYRKDGHPSIYRKAYKTDEERAAAKQSQDCSHWCLPGVPDTWNELLYASLLKAERRTRSNA